MIKCILVGLGGFIGAVLRYLIGLIPIKTDSGFPIKTMLINIAGAFAIGIVTALAAKNKSISPNFILMLQVGVCGGFTTFSTFAYEISDLIKTGNILTALLYILLSTVLSVCAVFAAQEIIKGSMSNVGVEGIK